MKHSDGIKAGETFEAHGRIHTNESFCLCCGQRIQAYRWKLLESHARALIKMYSRDKTAYHHYRDISDEGNNVLSKMKYWGLLEQATKNNNEKTLYSGMWKLTQDGIDFIEGKIKVPKHVHIYDDIVVKQSNVFVSFKEVYGQKFDFRDLVQSNEESYQKELF